MNSPNADEAAHLAAGIYNWRFGHFDLYPVNPPLVRMIAAFPAVLAGAKMDWTNYRASSRARPEARPEWSLGIELVRANRSSARRLFGQARAMCIPLSIIGAYLCWRWARELYGRPAGVVALVLWCFSPNVLAWSGTICPDIGAASLGLAAVYTFWRWLKRPDGFGALVAGITLGLALLTKLTWIIAVPLWPLMWLVSLFAHGPSRIVSREQAAARQIPQMIGLLGAAIVVLNLGFGFEGTFTRLRNFTFVSHALAGDESVTDAGPGGNRFATSWLGIAPIPVPINYVRGIDLQKYDFERGLPSYLCGRWSDRGWMHYYLVCAALKVPLGTWLLFLILIVSVLARIGANVAKMSRHEAVVSSRIYVASRYLDTAVLVAPAAAIFILVSLETGFSRHFRYVLPALPLLFVSVSSTARIAVGYPRTAGVILVGGLLWSVLSSLSVYPHSMSYFNELAGGPSGGHRYLLASNLDWGQDVYYLERWCRDHPEARPLRGLFVNSFSKDLLGLGDIADPPPGPRIGLPARRLGPADITQNVGPFPGWYAVSIQRIHDPDGRYLYFLRFRPFARAGYSIYIYHFTIDEVNRVRRELGLPELRSGDYVSC